MNTQEITKEDNKNLTLVERLKLRRSISATALLLDCSSSMAIEVEPGTSRMQALRNIVNSLPDNPNLYCFHDGYGKCTKDTIPNPHGATFLSELLNYLKQERINSAVLLTDGDITDKTNTLVAAKGMNLKIMYIGSGIRPAFLDKLAALCGGFATTEDLKMQKELSGKIQLLLGPNAATLGEKAIEL